MKLKVNLWGLLALVSLLGSNFYSPVIAQNPLPPVQAAQPAQVTPHSIQGTKSDLFGYVMDDSFPANWVNATTGTAVTFADPSSYSEAINLPFSFKYYENAYTSFLINSNGYLTFQTGPSSNFGSLITPSRPNNIIAPLWTPITLATSGTANRVFYKLLGDAPDRSIVVEWYQAGTNTLKYTFEAILHENGAIEFQYQTIPDSSTEYCADIGIEDSSGYDGIVLRDSCSWTPTIGPAVLFTRPGPAGRVNAYPRQMGGTPDLSGKVEEQFFIRNTGALGADAYDLTAATDPGWAVTLYSQAMTPLTDTNGNSKIDTGSLEQGQTLLVNAVITRTAIVVNIGDVHSVTLTAASALNPDKTVDVQIQTSIPPSFAQVYRDDVNGATSMDMMGNAGTQTVKTTADHWSGYNHAIATAPNGNLLTAWSKSYCFGNPCAFWGGVIEYAVNAPTGASLRQVTQLTAPSNSSNQGTYFNAQAAAAPDGRFGLAWYQYNYDSQNKHQCNVYTAIVDSTGGLVAGPTNITNHTAWNASWGENGAVCFSEVSIAATSDNRFITAYQKETYASSGTVDDLYTAIQGSSGNIIQGPVQRTADTAGWFNGYTSPNLTALSANRFLLAYSSLAYPNCDLMAMILNSSGDVVKPGFKIPSIGSSNYDQSPDGVMLPNGKILLGWWNNGAAFALLDPDQDFAVVAGPTHLAAPFNPKSVASVSVTHDAAGRGIISWENDDPAAGFSPNLYYAVTKADGSLLMDTKILRTSNLQTGGQFIITSDYGAGNTNLQQPIPTAGVDLYVTSPALVMARPGTAGSIQINLGNLGVSSAIGALTVDLGTDLGFVVASQTPDLVSGHLYTWNLSTMFSQAAGRLVLTVSLPASASNGNQYPVQVGIQAVGGSDLVPENNNLTLNMMAVDHFIYLPALNR